jgi:SAM-dependent methyltransferase
MAHLVFDERIAAELEAFYRTRDVLRRRRLVIEALDPRPGDRVLDVGCGPGFYVAEILDRVGESGAVTGLDASPAMLAITTRRVADRANATVLDGEATALPFAGASFDRAVSVQVLEYVHDTAAALAELRRVLRPGGRVALWDIDWSTLTWHSRDPQRMARMCAAWDRHLAHPMLPRTLGASLRAAGFEDVSCDGHVFSSTTLDPETFGGNLPRLVASYVEGLDDVPAPEVAAWGDELRDLDARGEYFFGVVQFCFTATRAA